MEGHRLVVVTGFVPIRGHPRSVKEYGELGDKILPQIDCVGQGCVVFPFYETLPETWLWKYVSLLSKRPNHSIADNPQKNTLAYHCVQHQKFAWLLKASLRVKAHTYIWMDYGIGHVPGVTPDVVNGFLAEVRENDFAIPGCWPRDRSRISDDYPCWRFCGGIMVVPRTKLLAFFNILKRQVVQHIKDTNNVTWEVNSLASAEPNLPPIRWYQADHNETMFTNYGGGNDSAYRVSCSKAG